MTLDDFLTLPLPKRIAWLHSEEGPEGKLSHDRFSTRLVESLGKAPGPSRQTIIGWEKPGGQEPNRFYADRLAEFSGFPAWVFRRAESEEAVAEMFARRLGELEARVAELATKEELHQGLETLREAIDAAATRGTRRSGQRKAAKA